MAKYYYYEIITTSIVRAVSQSDAIASTKGKSRADGAVLKAWSEAYRIPAEDAIELSKTV